MGNKKYQICKHCIMDTSDMEIEFTKNGECNYCHEYEYTMSLMSLSKKQGEEQLQQYLENIKNAGKEKEFDCIIGISGGADSSYVAYLTKKWELRPLAVHLDNGWDSELAVNNIKNILNKLNIELFTYVIDWNEFKDLQRSYFKASVIDIEVLTDHAILAALYKSAIENKIKYIVNGLNMSTEGILPLNWNFRGKNDLINLKSIQKIFGTKKISSFPTLGYIKKKYYQRIKGIKSFSPLNLVEYNKPDAIKILENELDWRNYKVKHGESVFTRFYQNYFLPKKFNIDKRRAHLSTMILSGQILREDALKEIAIPPYSGNEEDEDYEFVLKKLDFTTEEFENIIKNPPRSHFYYSTELRSKFQYWIWPKLKPLRKKLRIK